MQINNNNPLEFFFELLRENTFEKRKSLAINDFVENYGDYVSSVDYEKGIVKIKTFSDNNTVEYSTYNFLENFTETIKKEANNAIKNIDNDVYLIIKDNKSQNNYLKFQIKNLTFLLERVEKVYPKKLFIKDSLTEIIEYIGKKYSIKSHYKNVLSKSVTKYSFFEIKQAIKPSILINIYDFVIDVEIIDDEVIFEDAFIRVLSENPTQTEDFIIFKCNNSIAVHFINCIQPLFDNFSYSRIGESKSFYTKGKKLFTENNLSVSKTRINYDASKIKIITDKIAEIIQQ